MPRLLAFACATLVCVHAAARDLTLADAESLLMENNRELQAARRAVESADAQKLIAGARPNATVSLNSTAIASGNKADTVLRIDQPFERGNKRELRLDAAAGLQRAALSDSLDVQRQQLAAVRGAYFDLKLAQERSQVLAETAQLFAGTLSAAQRRLKAGDLAPADVAKVQVDYERSQNDARVAQADFARAQLALGYLIGSERDAPELRATDAWPVLARADVVAVEQAIEARPDVVAARQDITVGAQYEYYPNNVPANSVGFGVAVPLFTGYDFSGDIQKAEVDRYAAMDALARARAVALNDLRRAAEDLNAAADRLERFDGSLLGAANQSAQASEFAFSRGAISVLEVLDARRTLRAVRLDALAARNDHARALAAWRAAQAK